jgi:hypothetical protein
MNGTIRTMLNVLFAICYMLKDQKGTLATHLKIFMGLILGKI